MGFLLLGARPPFAHSLIIITHSPRTHSLHHHSLSLTHSSSSLTHHRKTVHATKRSVGGPPPASRARGGSLATTLRKTVNATINTLSEALDRHRPPWAKDCIIATKRFLGGPRPAPRARARACACVGGSLRVGRRGTCAVCSSRRSTWGPSTGPATDLQSTNMTLLLKPCEYQGLKGTAVAGRVVIPATQEVKTKVRNGMMAAAPSKGPGKSNTEHAGRVNEVVFIEAWVDQATQLGLQGRRPDFHHGTRSLTHSLTHSLTRIHLYTLCEKIEYTCGVIRSFNLNIVGVLIWFQVYSLRDLEGRERSLTQGVYSLIKEYIL